MRSRTSPASIEQTTVKDQRLGAILAVPLSRVSRHELYVHAEGREGRLPTRAGADSTDPTLLYRDSNVPIGLRTSAGVDPRRQPERKEVLRSLAIPNHERRGGDAFRPLRIGWSPCRHPPVRIERMLRMECDAARLDDLVGVATGLTWTPDPLRARRSVMDDMPLDATTSAG